MYLSSAPDGTLYVVDMYRGIIQHRAYITEYLRDQIKSRQLEQPIGLGRIYRVVHESTRRDAGRAFECATTQLVETLSHPNGWRRDTAQQLLVERGDRAAVAALLKFAAGAKDWRTRLHALWTLDALNGVEPTLVTKALDDPVTRRAGVGIAYRRALVVGPTIPSGAAVGSSRTMRIGRCGSNWRRRSARCRPRRASLRSCRCWSAMARIPSSRHGAERAGEAARRNACSACSERDRADASAGGDPRDGPPARASAAKRTFGKVFYMGG